MPLKTNNGHITVFITATAGLVTSYAYPDPLTTVTVSSGGLLTNTTLRYVDGQPKCTMQNGVIQSWNDYGVNADGTKWTITYTGPLGANSPMWQKITTDLLDHTIRTERPGFSPTRIARRIHAASGHLANGLCQIARALEIETILSQTGRQIFNRVRCL